VYTDFIEFSRPKHSWSDIWPVPAGALLQFYYIASMRVAHAEAGFALKYSDGRRRLR
jgi:hypothetical protein